MRPQKKLAICALMGLGYFSGICAIVRTVISMKVFKDGGLADFSWVIIDLRIWGLTENLVGIIAASIPTLKPLYAQALSSHYFPWSKKSSSKGYVAHSDDTPMKRDRARPPADPYSTTTIASALGDSDPDYPRGDKRGGGIQVQTNIEMDEFDERRPMAYGPKKADPVYKV